MWVCFTVISLTIISSAYAQNNHEKPISLAPRKNIDERLFLIHVLERTYAQWPTADADPAVIRSWIRSTRLRMTRLQKSIEVDNLDRHIEILYKECLLLLDDYQKFLLTIGAIKFEQISSGSIQASAYESALHGFGVARSANIIGIGGTYALAAGAVVVIGASVYNLYQKNNRDKELTQARKQQLDEQASWINHQFEKTYIAAETAVMKLSEKYRWRKGVAGFGGSNRSTLENQLINRPYDPFVLVKVASDLSFNGQVESVSKLVLRKHPLEKYDFGSETLPHITDVFDYIANNTFRQSNNILLTTLVDVITKSVLGGNTLNTQERIDDLLYRSRICVEAARLVPAGKIYDTFRAEIVATAARLATEAVINQLRAENGKIAYSNAPAPNAVEAISLLKTYLQLEPSDPGKIGQYELTKVLAANGNFDLAIDAANAAMEQWKDDLDFIYRYVRLTSLAENFDRTEEWLSYLFSRDFNRISFVLNDPDLIPFRQAKPDKFKHFTTVKTRYQLNFGTIGDDVVLYNESPFNLTDVQLTGVIKKGNKVWDISLETKNIDRYSSYKWTNAISIPGNQFDSFITEIKCDQIIQLARPGIGVSIQDSDTSGVLVTHISSDSAAAKAGLKVGDIITGIGYRNSIDTNKKLIETLSKYNIGDKVTVIVLRGTDRLVKPVNLQEIRLNTDGNSDHISSTRPGFGVTIRESNTGDVIINDVLSDSAAAIAGLKVGDIITDINKDTRRILLNNQIDTSEKLIKILGRYTIGDRVSATVIRGVDRLVLSIKLQEIPFNNSDHRKL